LKKHSIKELQGVAKEIRLQILKMGFQCKSPAHLGGGLSMVEIMATLYANVLRYNPRDPFWDERDRFILSKGHGVLGFFPILSHFGFFDQSFLDSFKQNGSHLVAHPVWNQELGIESSNGSLGHGLSMAAGIALAGKLKNSDYRTYVLLGDGECNEGSVWEAAMFCSQYRLDSLLAIVDWNGFQSDGKSIDVIENTYLPDMWRSFGWTVLEIDGHDFLELETAFCKNVIEGKPTVILAKTTKGKGISFMENNNQWHHNRLTEETYGLAVNEINAHE
jgi:transketolase